MLPVLLLTLCAVGSTLLLVYGVIWLYNKWQENKFGPIHKDIGFEATRFQILRYLSDQGTTI